jgi:hypothetical protein
MLTHLKVKGFKKFDAIDFPLNQSVVLIGPNNSGKTSALQALALWDLGLRKWREKRSGGAASKRPGVVINRRDLVALPVPTADLLWKDIHTRSTTRENGKQATQNIRIEIEVHGTSDGKTWQAGFEFDYANQESFYCRPLRLETESAEADRMVIPDVAFETKIALLPPMSGLADREFRKQPGEIAILVGQGQTAQVFRNLCYRVCYPSEASEKPSDSWRNLTAMIRAGFGIELLPPSLAPDKAEILMRYQDPITKVKYDITSAGRGLQQTVLLYAHVLANPKTVLLLDEPDAHLEVLRQRQVYDSLVRLVTDSSGQLIAASHSEVILQEAVHRSTLVSFVGKPKVFTDKLSSQIIKSLTDIGWDQYYQAEQVGWVLYLEDSTDLAILQEFAKILNHPSREHLEKPFVRYIGSNIPQKAREHFFGLKAAKNDFYGLALFDNLDKNLQSSENLFETMWRRREIENYFCSEAILIRWLEDQGDDDLIDPLQDRFAAMTKAISEVKAALELDGEQFDSITVKATDQVLDRVFRRYFQLRNLPLTFRKSQYAELVRYLSPESISDEVTEKLDKIVEVAKRAVVSN